MRTSKVFVLGAISGAAVVWLWGREMQQYVEEKTRALRTSTADSVRTAEEKTATLINRGTDTLRRADAFVQHTKENVSETLRAAQDAIRPAPAARPT